MKLKKLLITAAMAAVGSSVLFAAQFDTFLKLSDGLVIGVVGTNKTSMSVSSDIKEIIWVAANGNAVKLTWDGNKLTSETIK
jgi:hypothetical protein